MLSLLQFQIPTNMISFSYHDTSKQKHFRSKRCCSSQTKTIRYGSSNHFGYSCSASNSRVLRLPFGGKPKSAASQVSEDQMELPEGLDPQLIPRHIAVIMDGNRRWAKARGLNPQQGHKAGVESLKSILEASRDFGVKILSVFAFSTENWGRPKEEVDYLMGLFEETIKADFEKIMQKDTRVTFLGDKSRFPESLRAAMCSLEGRSKHKKGQHFVMATNYSGRYDIYQATRKIARKVEDGVVQLEDIDEKLFEQHLETSCLEFPIPDVMIRTSGELRISNFMLWQLADTELIFYDKMFPDVNREDVVQVLKGYQQKRRCEK